jgi:hypothetical protein
VSGTEHKRRERPQVITDAREGMSADISYRQRRYLLMMSIRIVCFVAAILVFVYHGGWLAAFPLVGAIAIPYFAVVFANGGREPAGRRPGFREYVPNLPQRFPPSGNGHRPDGDASPGGSDIPGSNGAPPHSS